MSLHTKYRPRKLEGLKGNGDLVRTLGTLLEKEDRPHSFLLHGPTGCGKTTIARIIARKLNCKGLDLREIQTADFRGIDTVRDLIQKSQYMPVQSACTIWILDECHKLTNDAQNALLKILEEPPDHVYFILCTTEPQKLLSTIKGRCSQFQVKPLSDEDMLSLLQQIVSREEEELEQEVYDIIIRDSVGLARNALQILEQVLNAPAEDRARVAEHAQTEYAEMIGLCRELMKNNGQWKGVASILTGLKDQEAESIRRVVLGYCQAILLKTDNVRAGMILEAFIDPFYDSGYPQLVYACYTVIKTK